MILNMNVTMEGEDVRKVAFYYSYVGADVSLLT